LETIVHLLSTPPGASRHPPHRGEGGKIAVSWP
jgi:hypothetical protein